MAYGFRLDDPRMAYIRLSRADLEPAAVSFGLRLDGVEHGLTLAALKQETLSINDELCQVERILDRGPNRQAVLVVRSAAGEVVHEELVLFHHSFFRPFVDYVKSMPTGGGYEKPGLLAVFTHAFDDNAMLRFWEAHHARLAGHGNLYVIDHGSAVSPKSALHPETNVVPLPRGETDHANLARFCGHFQRFLLSQYRHVLHTDADELVAHEGGAEAFLAALADGSLEGIVRPGHAADIIHDTRREARLEQGRPVSGQRGFMLPATDLYRKPVLASVPASWLEGFHLVYEEHAMRTAPGLWLLHLQAADFDLLLDKNRRWNALGQTGRDRAISPQNRPDDPEALARWFEATLADTRLAPVPERLRGLF